MTIYSRLASTIAFAALALPFVAMAESAEDIALNRWGDLENTWIRLPRACGINLDEQCGGDEISIREGVLRARPTCSNVRLKIRDRTEDTWRVAVIGAQPCMWNGHRVRLFIFSMSPRPAKWLSFDVYSSERATSESSLFHGSGYEQR